MPGPDGPKDPEENPLRLVGRLHRFLRTDRAEIDIDNAELVFAGYGIVAPSMGKMISRESRTRRIK